MWMYRTLASRYHRTHLYLARLYHQKYKIESIRISLSHSSSSTRIHSCLTSKPINSNILPLNIKIRLTQSDSFYSSVICIRLQKSESISSLKAHADNNLSGQQWPLFFLLCLLFSHSDRKNRVAYVLMHQFFAWSDINWCKRLFWRCLTERSFIDFKRWNVALKTKIGARIKKNPRRIGGFSHVALYQKWRLKLVRITGVEPARLRHQILSLARLPISPYPHDSSYLPIVIWF